jgi:hypothetical protein
MAATACKFFGLADEAKIYISDRVISFHFDGCSSINDYLEAILQPDDYTTITQLVCRPHDLSYGVCTSAKTRLAADQRFKSDLTHFAPFLDKLQIDAAYYMVRRFGTLCPKWSPGFALLPEYRVKVA